MICYIEAHIRFHLTGASEGDDAPAHCLSGVVRAALAHALGVTAAGGHSGGPTHRGAGGEAVGDVIGKVLTDEVLVT